MRAPWTLLSQEFSDQFCDAVATRFLLLHSCSSETHEAEPGDHRTTIVISNARRHFITGVAATVPGTIDTPSIAKAGHGSLRLDSWRGYT